MANGGIRKSFLSILPNFTAFIPLLLISKTRTHTIPSSSTIVSAPKYLCIRVCYRIRSQVRDRAVFRTQLPAPLLQSDIALVPFPEPVVLDFQNLSRMGDGASLPRPLRVQYLPRIVL